MDLLARMGLLDFETTPEPEPPPGEPAPPEPAPEPTPEPGEPEPEAWAGPSREEWEQAQTQLSQYQQFMDQLQQPYYPEPEPEPEAYQQLPEFDPFDPESAGRYFEARDQRLLGAIDSLINERVGPMSERYADERATEWADSTLGRLGVPEEEHWRDGVLFASAGFQQFDAYGRPLVHPQQAAQQGYEFLKRFAEAEREAEREKIKQEGLKQDEALRARAGAPAPQTGPAGAEGTPAGMDELAAARAWREQQFAAQS